MRELSPLLAPRSGVARVSDLLETGTPRWRLYARDLSRPIRGVVGFPREDPDNFLTRIRALRLLLTSGTFVSRRSAAALYGIPVDVPTYLEVGAIRPQKAPQRQGLRAHQIGERALRSIPHEPTWLPDPTDTWALMGAVCSPQELIIAGDYLVSGASRRTDPLCTIDDLRAAVERFSGCTGVRNLQAALPYVRAGVESPAETRTRLLIVGADLPEPTTCCPVAVLGRVLHADMGYPERRIVIEYDGAYHFENGIEQARRDNERAEAMSDAGWRVLRVTALDLRQPAQFLARLRRALVGRAGMTTSAKVCLP